MIPFNIPRFAIYAALTAAVLLFTGWQGYLLGSARLDAYKAEQFAKAAEVIQKRGAVTERVVTRYVQKAGETRTVTETVEKEVIRYAEANPGLCLDADWRRLHDTSARNQLPNPAKPAAGSM